MIFPILRVVHSGYWFVENVIVSSITQFTPPAFIVNFMPPAPVPVENSVPLVAVPTLPETDPTTEKVAVESPPPNVQVNVQFSFTVLKGRVFMTLIVPFPVFVDVTTGTSSAGWEWRI